MAILGIILIFCLILGLAFVPMLLLVKLMGAVFSPELREQIRERWLFHLLWAVAAVLIVMAIVTTGSGSHSPLTRRAENEVIMSNLRTAILSYETEYGVSPEGKDNASFTKSLVGGNSRRIEFLSLKKSQIDSQGEALDAWGTPLRIDMTDPDHPKILSAGPDQKWGTADDMTGGDTLH